MKKLINLLKSVFNAMRQLRIDYLVAEGGTIHVTRHIFNRRENQKKSTDWLAGQPKKKQKKCRDVFQFFNVFSGFLIVFFFTTTV